MYDRCNLLQKHLLSNHLSTYDPSSMQVTIENHLFHNLIRFWNMFFLLLKANYVWMQIYLDSTQEGLPDSYENESISWLPEDGHNPAHIFVGPDPSTLYDPLPHAPSINMDPPVIGGGCHISNHNDESLPPWHQQSYTSTELLSALMSPTSCPLIKVPLVFLFRIK